MALQSKGPHFKEIRSTVVELTTDEFTLNANHPLTGQDLSFKIQLSSISQGFATRSRRILSSPDLGLPRPSRLLVST